MVRIAPSSLENHCWCQCRMVFVISVWLGFRRFAKQVDGWWGVWNLITNGDVTSGPAITFSKSFIHVFARSTIGTLQMAASDDSGETWEWQDLGGRVQAGSSPCVISNPTGDVMLIAVRGVDNSIWSARLIRGGRKLSPWTRIQTLGGITSSPALDGSSWPSVSVSPPRKHTVQTTQHPAGGFSLAWILIACSASCRLGSAGHCKGARCNNILDSPFEQRRCRVFR